MKITVELPDDFAQRLDPARVALEALAIEGSRSGALTHYEARQFLALSRVEFNGFVKRSHVEEHAYDVADLEQDIATIEWLDEAGLTRRP